MYHNFCFFVVIEGYGHTSSVDWWTFGIFIYEILFGKTPYKGKDTEDTWRNIVKGNLVFPDTPAVSSDAKALIKKLLTNDAKKRLGAEHGALDIKENKWFKAVNFESKFNLCDCVGRYARVCAFSCVAMPNARCAC